MHATYQATLANSSKHMKRIKFTNKNDTATMEVSSGIPNSTSTELEEKSADTVESSRSFSENSEDISSSRILSENEEKSLEVDMSDDSTAKTGDAKYNKEDKENRTTNVKRPSSDSENAPSKKTRKKPKPQVIEDMKDYYDKDSVSKLSTATLRYWLKDHLIHCTTRDKKDALVEKVKNYFLENANKT